MNNLFHTAEDIAAATLSSGKCVFYPYAHAGAILVENAVGSTFASKISERLASGQSYRRWCVSVPESNQSGAMDVILHLFFRENPVGKKHDVERFC